MFKKINVRLKYLRVKLIRAMLALSLVLIPVQHAGAANPADSFWENYSPEKAAASLNALLPYADTQTQIKRGSAVKTIQNLKTVFTTGGEALEGRIIVGYKAGFGDESRQALHKKLGLYDPKRSQITAALGPDMELVDVSNAGGLEKAVAIYKAADGVSFAEPDYIVNASLTPTDTSYSSQWGMDQVRAPQAWDITRGSRTNAIAVLDCGIYVGAISTFGPGHRDLNAKVVGSLNLSSATDADDWCNHGSHVAGIAAADTNNGMGVAGAGFDSSLVNIKVLGDDGRGTDSMVINGIFAASANFPTSTYAVNIKVINMSLGKKGACPASFQAAIDFAFSRNIVVVAAAGNEGTSERVAPASCNNTLAVGNTDYFDNRTASSSFGESWVDMAAPGTNILSTDFVGGYVAFTGTSMAAPHVSGTAALVWSTGRYSSATEVVNKLLESSDPIPGTGTFWSKGRLNAYNAVR